VDGFLLLAGSAALLAAGANLFAGHAAAAGRRLGVTPLAVGLILAGAEPEELFTVVTASLRGRPGLAVGDAIGANLTMLTVVLGLAALLQPLPLSGRVRGYAVGASVAGTAAAAMLADGVVSRGEGGVLLLVYATLVTVVWRRERQPPAIGEAAEALEDDGDPAGPRKPRLSSLFLAVAGIAAMTLGGSLAVDGAERLVASLSATDTAVGLTFLALATTAELLALVWAAARRDVRELAVAAVVGSAAYNATASLGAGAVVRPLAAAGGAVAAVVAAALPVGVLLLGGTRQRLTRPAGAFLVAAYAVFVTVVLA
jgi:cation:H+ antiporter